MLIINKLFSLLVSVAKLQLRTKVYHYAQPPKLIKPSDLVSVKDESLYKPIVPACKWEHTGSNHDPVIRKFIGMLTSNGEREVARNVLRLTFREIKLIQLRKNLNTPEETENTKLLSPITIFHEAIKNCTPLLVLHSVVRGGILYKVPAPPVSESVARHIAIKFLIDSAREKPTHQRIWISLAQEVISASNNQGKSFRKMTELHKKCEENRAYANYRTY